tara:strand:+ start:3465 stop:3899 length:435 start_codon:yes stop_codon:yes gene_type:complete
MPSYPAKPYFIPYDDWFNNNSSNFQNKSKVKGAKNISTIHEFFFRESDVKVGGSDNHIQTNFPNKSSKKIRISSSKNSDKSFFYKSEEKYSYSKIPREVKLLTKKTLQGTKFSKNLPNKNIFNFRSYLYDLKSFFHKITSRKKM